MTRDHDRTDHDALRVYLETLAAVSPLSRGEEQQLYATLGQVEEALRSAVLDTPEGLDLVAELGRELGRGELRAADLSARANLDAFDEAAERERMLGLIEGLGKNREPMPTGGRLPAEDRERLGRLGLDRRAVLRLAQKFLRKVPADSGATAGRLEQVATLLARAEQVKAELFTANLRLVLHVAKRYLGRGLPLLDLVQEGNLGLLRAIEGFEVERGNRLATYAVWWIRQAMRHALAEQGRTIRVPRHLLETLGTVQRFARRFLGERGRQPTADEVSRALGLPLSGVQQAIEALRDTVSYDAPLTDDGQLGLGDVLADDDAGDPSEYLLDKDFARHAQAILLDLDDDERRVLTLRFGIGDGSEHTVEEAANRLGLTRERLRELEARAIRKLQRTKTARSLRVFVRG